MWLRTIKLTSLCCLLFIAGCQNIKLSEQSFLFPDKPITQNILDKKGLDQTLTNLSLKTADDVQLGGIAVTQPNAKFTTIYFGGNQSRIKQIGQSLVEHLTGFENNFIAFDHRGYGLSHGEPNIQNLKADANAIFDFIKSNPKLKDLPIIVHGLSLGSVIAAELANNRDIDALVLEGSATTINDMFDENIPVLIKPFLNIELDEALSQIDNQNILSSNTKPLLILVGENDYQTPVALSEKLFSASASSQKQLLIINEKGHGNATESEEFKSEFRKFAATIVVRNKL